MPLSTPLFDPILNELSGWLHHLCGYIYTLFQFRGWLDELVLAEHRLLPSIDSLQLTQDSLPLHLIAPPFFELAAPLPC